MPISHRTFLKKLDFEKYADFLDVKIEDTASHKRKKIITLREYRDLLFSGLTRKQLIQQGHDRHLIDFYSALLQDKVVLSKEQFDFEYKKTGDLDGIAKEHNISRGHLTFLRELYGIKKRGAPYQNRIRNEPELTERQKQVIRGAFLGDGGRLGNSSIKIKHSLKQKEYVEWKHEQLSNISSTLKDEEADDSRFKIHIEATYFYTRANSFVESLIERLYKSGTKSVARDYLDEMDDLALAVWFQDDGDTDWRYKSLLKGWETKPTCKLNTQSFTKVECEMICQWFNDKYGLSPIVRTKKSDLSGNTGYIVSFHSEDTLKLHDIVRPYIVPCMKYKVNFQAYLKHSGRILPPSAKYTAKKCPLGKDFYNLSHEDRDKWIEGALYHLRRCDFPHPRISENEKFKYLHKILDYDASELVYGGDVKYKNDNSTFILSFHKHFIRMRSKESRSLHDLYNDDSVLRDVILYTIGRGNKPYGRTIVHSLRYYRGSKIVGTFPTFGSKAIYDFYCPENGKVLDFCAGFGNRMVGAWASEKVFSYTGIDACAPTVNGLNNIKRNCQTVKHKEMTILHGDSKVLLERYDDKSFDFIFTSPPYFDREFYSSDNLQSSIQYPEYSKWLQEWLFVCINHCLRLLSDRGCIIINIADCKPYLIAEDLCKYIEGLGHKISLQRVFIAQNKHEPLLIIGNKPKQKYRDIFG